MLKARVFPNYKNMIRIICFCIVLTVNTCSMHGDLHYHVRSPMVYVNRLWRRRYYWRWLLLFSHLIKLNCFFIYSNLTLTYISDMLQIFDNDYVTLILFARSFKYIFSKLDSDHTSSSAYWISFPLLTQLPAYIHCVHRQYVCGIKDLLGQGGGGILLF